MDAACHGPSSPSRNATSAAGVTVEMVMVTPGVGSTGGESVSSQPLDQPAGTRETRRRARRFMVRPRGYRCCC